DERLPGLDGRRQRHHQERDRPPIPGGDEGLPNDLRLALADLAEGACGLLGPYLVTHITHLLAVGSTRERVLNFPYRKVLSSSEDNTDFSCWQGCSSTPPSGGCSDTKGEDAAAVSAVG